MKFKTLTKHCGREEKLRQRSQTSGVKLHVYFLNVVVDLFFFNSEDMICRGTDISKYSRKSLRDNGIDFK